MSMFSAGWSPAGYAFVPVAVFLCAALGIGFLLGWWLT